MDLVVWVEAQCFGIHCFVALAQCGGFMEVFDGFWPLGTHTFWVDLFVWCFDGLALGDFVLGFFRVVAFATARAFC